MNCKEINRLDPLVILEDYGFMPVSIKGKEALFNAPYRRDETPSLSLNLEKKIWVDFGTGEGGSLVDLLMKIHDTVTVSSFLREFESRRKSLYPIGKKLFPEDKIKRDIKPNILSVGPICSKSLFEYVKQRAISISLARSYLKEIRYEIKGRPYYGLAFENRSGGFEIRNRVLKNPICLGAKDITIIEGKLNGFLLFEGFFDFLSFAKKNGQVQCHTIVLNSTVNTNLALEFLSLKKNPEIRLFLDNDAAGRKATIKIQNIYSNAIDESSFYHDFKDINEWLIENTSDKGIVKNSNTLGL